MANLLHLCETLTQKWMDEEAIHVPIEVLKEFAKKNNFLIRQKVFRKKNKISLARKLIPIYFISGDEEEEISFLDISDLHIGHADFSEELLRATLKQAVDTSIKYVFIAGDIFEGLPNNITIGDEAFSIEFEQINTAYQIFKDYPLKYFVINGNHDYMFEQIGLNNPIKKLAKMLEKVNIEFHFFDVYLMDFVIGGVVKRVMHVERQYYSKRRNFALTKLKQLEEQFGITAMYNGEEYPIRFFHAGHIHVNVLIYNPRRKVFISQAGSFLKSDSMEDRGNFISARIIDKKVFFY